VAARQFVYFLISGGVAAALNWGSRFLFSEFVRFEVAVVLAFLVGLLSGFILMRVFVFSGGGKPIAPQAGKYVAVNLFALLQTLVISLVLARWLLPSVGIVEHAEALAHLVGVLVPVVTSYFGHKFLTFR
jgi:putative flippase GtrA